MQRAVLAVCGFALVAGRSLRASNANADVRTASGLVEFGSQANSMGQTVVGPAPAPALLQDAEGPAPAPGPEVPDSQINPEDEAADLARAALRPVPLSRQTRSGDIPYGVKQCTDFVRDRLAHGYVGEAFLKEMASTCGPPVGTGIAQIPYQRACTEVKRITAGHANSMGSVDLEAFCVTVMDAFQSYRPAPGLGR